jgi:hypothetical protein
MAGLYFAQYRNDADEAAIRDILKDKLGYDPYIHEYWINEPFAIVHVQYYSNGRESLVSDTVDYKSYIRHKKLKRIGI